jgi:uncharacterized membrane protein YkvA (DUF1232 family)
MAYWWRRFAFARSVFSDVRLAIRLTREPRVPVLVKTLPVLALLYVVCPLDLFPDLLPMFGQIDDIGVMFVALKLFLGLCPAPYVAFHRNELRKGRRYSAASPSIDTIDAEFQHG